VLPALDPLAPPKPRPRKAFAPQLDLPRPEIDRLEQRIDEDYTDALADHEARMRRFIRYYSRWRNLPDVQPLGQENKNNFRVPLLTWQTYGKWAKEIDSLFGEDAEIVAAGVGPSDARRVRKVAKFMQWRLFDSMRVLKPATLFSFRKILFGRSHAFMPWDTRKFRVPMDDGTWTDHVAYDGPGFHPLWPDDILVPAEDVDSIQRFSFVIRKFRMTPDALLHGQDEGHYRNLDGIYEDLVNFAENGGERDEEADYTKWVADEAEGVVRDSLSSRGSLRVWAWYGRWRKLKGRRDARIDNLQGRERYESDLLVHYLPDLQRVIGVQDLAEMYPTSEHRRPFVESALTVDGSYWGPSFGELLERLEEEMSRAHQLGDKAGAMSVGPVIFYRPDSGFDPENFVYEPFTTVAVENPQGINVVQTKADLNYPILVQQEMGAHAERCTGQTDQNLGRQSDRPNAPRTARQFIGLIEEGNVRASIDVKVLREDWREILDWGWQLETMYGSPQQFFRVTEEEARGLFQVSQGGAFLTSAERSGTFDFQLKLASSAQSREVEKERTLQLYQADMANPLINTNPRALWIVTRKVHEALGDPEFYLTIPEPAQLELPRKPAAEWIAILQGEEVFCHPEDIDEQHLRNHYKHLQEHKALPPDQQDAQAVARLAEHVAAHHQQMAQKKLMAALTNQLIGNMAQNIGTGKGLQPGGMPLSLANIGQVVAGLTGEGGEGQPGQGQPGQGQPPGMPQAA
jgi:hypothetical protein